MGAEGTRTSWLAVVALGVVGAALGPRVSGPQNRPGRVPFDYSPPEGFELSKDAAITAALDPKRGSERAWVHPTVAPGYVPNVTSTSTSSQGAVEPEDLEKLSRGMPQVFGQSGVAWTEVRHETRVRQDGAHVGLIEGECKKGDVRYRALQLIFPHDQGTAIVTASFPVDQAPRWEPAFEASIGEAKGVATRLGPPSSGVYIAWGLGASVLAYLGLALMGRSKDRRSKSTVPTARRGGHED